MNSIIKSSVIIGIFFLHTNEVKPADKGSGEGYLPICKPGEASTAARHIGLNIVIYNICSDNKKISHDVNPEAPDEKFKYSIGTSF